MRLKLYRGKWAIVGRDSKGRPYRRSLGTSDRAEADRRFRDSKIELPGNTIADVVAIYLEEKRGARSFKSMVTAWRALEQTFGHLRCDQVNRELCRKYAMGRRANGVGDGTVIKDLGVLKAAITFCGKGSQALFEMPAAPAPRERYITRSEHQRLVDACEFPHIRLFIILAWATAARASALFELEWSQVDFMRGQIRLHKGPGRRKGRATVPMTTQAWEALEEALKEKTNDYVIEWGGDPIKTVKTSFALACKKAGLEDVSPHVLRHSAAVAMVESGVPIVEVAQYLGHTNPAVTYKVYGRFSPDYLRKAAAALE